MTISQVSRVTSVPIWRSKEKRSRSQMSRFRRGRSGSPAVTTSDFSFFLALWIFTIKGAMLIFPVILSFFNCSFCSCCVPSIPWVSISCVYDVRNKYWINISDNNKLGRAVCYSRRTRTSSSCTRTAVRRFAITAARYCTVWYTRASDAKVSQPAFKFTPRTCRFIHRFSSL